MDDDINIFEYAALKRKINGNVLKRRQFSARNCATQVSQGIKKIKTAGTMYTTSQPIEKPTRFETRTNTEQFEIDGRDKLHSPQLFNLVDSRSSSLETVAFFTDSDAKAFTKVLEENDIIADDSDSVSDAESESLLKDVQNEEVQNVSNGHDDDDDTVLFFGCVSTNKSEQNAGNEEKSTLSNVAVENDSKDVEDKCESSFVGNYPVNKVTNWLNSMEDASTVDIESTSRDSCHSVGTHTDDTSLVTDRNSNDQACLHIHIHFHNSPKKVIQTTLDTFFEKVASPTAKNPTQSSVIKNESPSKDNTEAIKNWKALFNKKKTQSSPLKSAYPKKFIKNEKLQPAEKRVRGKCPFYKLIEDTTFAVDAFSYGNIDGVSSYFLSHYHYDHYRGLTKNFSKPIYCSVITANLLRTFVKVKDQLLHPLPLEEPRVIDGVEVSLHEANHCPGAVMFVFRLSSGKCLLHVGDFRAHSAMEGLCRSLSASLDVLYLDTTYLSEEFSFAPQEEVLKKCRSIALRHQAKDNDTVFIVGSYTIGKERVFKAMAEALDCSIYCPPAKARLLRCLEDDCVARRLSASQPTARVHVLPMKDLKPMIVKKYVASFKPSCTSIVVVRPTGWVHTAKLARGLDALEPEVVGGIYTYAVPYSEHSSYSELEWFVRECRPRKVIPTVNVGKHSLRTIMESTISGWIT